MDISDPNYSPQPRQITSLGRTGAMQKLTCSTACRKAASLARSSSRMRAELAAASASLRSFSSVALLLPGLLGPP